MQFHAEECSSTIKFDSAAVEQREQEPCSVEKGGNVREPREKPDRDRNDPVVEICEYDSFSARFSVRYTFHSMPSMKGVFHGTMVFFSAMLCVRSSYSTKVT